MIEKNKIVKVIYIIDKKLHNCKMDLDYLLKGYFEVPMTKEIPLLSNPMKPVNVDIRRKRLRTIFKLNEYIYYAGINEDEINQIIKLHNIEKEL